MKGQTLVAQFSAASEVGDPRSMAAVAPRAPLMRRASKVAWHSALTVVVVVVHPSKVLQLVPTSISRLADASSDQNKQITGRALTSVLRFFLHLKNGSFKSHVLSYCD